MRQGLYCGPWRLRRANPQPAQATARLVAKRSQVEPVQRAFQADAEVSGRRGRLSLQSPVEPRPGRRRTCPGRYIAARSAGTTVMQEGRERRLNPPSGPMSEEAR